jgi:hypothetical protein
MKMRGHQPAGDGFFRVVFQRKNDPVRIGAILLGADGHTADNPVGSGCCGDLDGIAVGAVEFDLAQQINHGGAGQQPHGLDSLRGEARKQEGHAEKDTENVLGQQNVILFRPRGFW